MSWTGQDVVMATDTNCRKEDEGKKWNGMKTYNGIICGHAYSILGAYEYGGERLVKIRNPWSGGEYTGEWSDKDTSKWDTNAKQQLDHSLHSGTNDGVFFMPLNKFTEFLSATLLHMSCNGGKK